MGELEESLREIRECLKLDPEHKHCFPLYKKLKKLDKFVQDAEKSGEAEQYEECSSDLKKVNKHFACTTRLLEQEILNLILLCLGPESRQQPSKYVGKTN